MQRKLKTKAVGDFRRKTSKIIIVSLLIDKKIFIQKQTIRDV